MAGNTIVFTSLTAANPYTPPPTGYTKPSGSDDAKIEAAVLKHFGRASGSNAIWYDNTSMQGSVIVAKVLASYHIYNLMGACIVNASGNGYCFLAGTSTNNFRYFFVVNGQLGTQIGSTIAVAPTASVTYQFERNTTTGVMRILDAGGTQIGASSPADLTYSDARFAGAITRGGYIVSLTSDYTPAQTVTSINGGSPITAGQTGIAIEATGFSAKPTGVTATYASGAKSITATVDSGGTATNFNISIQDRIEAEDWPLNGDTLTFTFTYLSESASGTQTLVKKADEVVLTVSGGITSDPATWTYWLNDDGFTVEGGEHVYDPYGDLVLTADGGGSATDAGTFTSWFRPATGTGAGNVYAYTWVITEAGISPAGSGLTSSGLTVSGLTIAGL